ncbi:MAG: site-specific integrase [Gemmatimonadetes bacterium]|nr:site-specific integrase [Gemmatimonadota bacterium]
MSTWTSSLDRARYDSRPHLTPQECDDLAALSQERFFHRATERERRAWRLYAPLKEALVYCGGARYMPILWGAFIEHMLRLDRSYFGWSVADWEAFVDPTGACGRRHVSRGIALAAGYLVCDFRGFTAFAGATAYTTTIAQRVFGHAAVAAAHGQVRALLQGVGYPPGNPVYLRRSLSLLLLKAGSPCIEDIEIRHVDQAYVQGNLPACARRAVYRISRALEIAGITERSAHIPAQHRPITREGLSPEWTAWCQRWRAASTRTPKAKDSIYSYLMRMGLWLAERHPEVTTPGGWSTETCLDFLAMASEAVTGQYTFIPGRHPGKPLTAKSKSALIHAVRTFFRDLHAWQWIEPTFAPHIALGLPASLRRLMGPSPRDIEEKTWLKLVWASLNFGPEDLRRGGATGRSAYPYEFVRAVAVLWTHAGLRVNELSRLRCDCIRAQTKDLVDEQTGRRFPAGSICYLSVPYSKTSPPFSKPVAGVVREVVEAWLALRPQQPKRLDLKTGHLVDHLLSYRGRQVSTTYINTSVIPMLCRKAGVAEEDAKGRITSHRGRSSAVTMLANARSGLSLMELMKWCGHTNPSSTLQYVRLRPNRLAKAYAQADETSYLIEVLIDQQAVLDGSAAAGTSWKYYDLGDSYCTHAFWSTCPHRLACAGCAFNVPKASAKGQALEAKAFLERYLERVPLTDEERLAVSGDLAKFDEMLSKLERVAAPDGQTYAGAGASDAGDVLERRALTTLIPLPLANAPSEA